MGLRSAKSGLFGSNSHNETTPQAPLTTTTGWRPTCKCYNDLYRQLPAPRNARKRAQRMAWDGRWKRVRRRPGNSDWPSLPCIVLDPFGGSGTTLKVATKLGRQGVITELKPQYVELAHERNPELPLFEVAL